MGCIEFIFNCSCCGRSNKIHQLDTTKCTGNVVAVAMNRDETLLVGLFEEKGLMVWSLSDFSVLSHRAIPRNALALTCGEFLTKDSEKKECVIIGEKTGEVLAFPLPLVGEGLENLLQHTTSMITDLVTSSDSRYLITADRDEKIRVSNFPATVLTKSYCLGHQAFVAKVAVSKGLLASIGGRGTVFLWDFMTGTLLSSVCLPIPQEEDFVPTVLSFCPYLNCLVAACSSRNQVFVIQYTSSNEFVHQIMSVNVEAPPQSIAFDVKDHNMVVTYSIAPYISRWSLRAGKDIEAQSLEDESLSCFREIAEKLGDDPVKEIITGDNECALKKKRLKDVDWESKLPKV